MITSEVFDGKYCYFLRRKGEYKGKPEWFVMGTCCANDHWQALNKFERGLGASPMEHGEYYELYRDAGKLGREILIRFVY